MTMEKGRLGKWTALIATSCGLADEVFGRLFVEMGVLDFMGRCSFQSVDPTVNTVHQY
jgi:hypothetical protein